MVDVLKNEFFGKYFDFKGRTNRKNFWLAILGLIILSIIVNWLLPFVLGFIGDIGTTIAGIISLLFGLAILIPELAMDIRRLHDIGKSGWWILISLVPLVGCIILLVFFCMDSK